MSCRSGRRVGGGRPCCTRVRETHSRAQSSTESSSSRFLRLWYKSCVRVRSVCTTRSAGLSQASVGCDTAEVQDHGDVLGLLCGAKPLVPCIRAELLSPQLHFHASFMFLMIFYLCFSLGLRG